jgi:carbon-monoxide dehydrogenase medium subunit
MYAFEYHRPTSVRQAAALASKAEDMKFLAGGHTLLPTMKMRLAAPANLVDLGQIAELRGIERSARSVTIGAMTKHAEVAHSAEVREAIPALAEMAELIGDPHVRHRGTLGGSVANNDPSADYPAACLALNATIVTNKRKITADEFFQGIFTTALEEGEIITKVSFPVPSKAAYAKFRNPASRYALVGVFVAKRASEVRVAVTGAGSNGVFRVPEMEQALSQRFAAKSLDGIAVSADGMNSDIHADAAYRAHLVGVMARRAVQAATARG